MKICRYGHPHPPFGVKQSQNPLTGQEGRIHCFKCGLGTNKRTIDENWLSLHDPDSIETLMASDCLCRHCFPPSRYEQTHHRRKLAEPARPRLDRNADDECSPLSALSPAATPMKYRLDIKNGYLERLPIPSDKINTIKLLIGIWGVVGLFVVGLGWMLVALARWLAGW